MESFEQSQKAPGNSFPHFFRLGLLELLFVFFLLGLVFFVLQYFNVVNFKGLYSSHESISPKTKNQELSSLPPTYAVIEKYVSPIAKSYLQQQLKTPYLPIKNGEFYYIKPYYFYKINQPSLGIDSLVVQMQFQGNLVKKMIIILHPSLTNVFFINDTTANKIIPLYFANNIEQAFTCGSYIQSLSYCEQSQSTKDGLESYGIFGNNTNNFNVFSCHISGTYGNKYSCLNDSP